MKRNSYVNGNIEGTNTVIVRFIMRKKVKRNERNDKA